MPWTHYNAATLLLCVLQADGSCEVFSCGHFAHSSLFTLVNNPFIIPFIMFLTVKNGLKDAYDSMIIHKSATWALIGLQLNAWLCWSPLMGIVLCVGRIIALKVMFNGFFCLVAQITLCAMCDKNQRVDAFLTVSLRQTIAHLAFSLFSSVWLFYYYHFAAKLSVVCSTFSSSTMEIESVFYAIVAIPCFHCIENDIFVGDAWGNITLPRLPINRGRVVEWSPIIHMADKKRSSLIDKDL